MVNVDFKLLFFGNQNGIFDLMRGKRLVDIPISF